MCYAPPNAYPDRFIGEHLNMTSVVPEGSLPKGFSGPPEMVIVLHRMGDHHHLLLEPLGVYAETDKP